jgi:hypothetical protein
MSVKRNKANTARKGGFTLRLLLLALLHRRLLAALPLTSVDTILPIIIAFVRVNCSREKENILANSSSSSQGASK